MKVARGARDFHGKGKLALRRYTADFLAGTWQKIENSTEKAEVLAALG
jgi:hypothetical protein